MAGARTVLSSFFTQVSFNVNGVNYVHLSDVISGLEDNVGNELVVCFQEVSCWPSLFEIDGWEIHRELEASVAIAWPLHLAVAVRLLEIRAIRNMKLQMTNDSEVTLLEAMLQSRSQRVRLEAHEVLRDFLSDDSIHRKAVLEDLNPRLLEWVFREHMNYI